MPQDLKTIDIWGARAIHDAFGPEGAANQIRHLVELGIPGTLPPIAAQSGIGTGSFWCNPTDTDIAFTMKIDRKGDWIMIGDALSALEGAAPGIPETVIAGIVGQPITDLLAHPWLDSSMIVDQVIFRDVVTGFILTNVSRSIADVLRLLDEGIRP